MLAKRRQHPSGTFRMKGDATVNLLRLTREGGVGKGSREARGGVEEEGRGVVNELGYGKEENQN